MRGFSLQHVGERQLETAVPLNANLSTVLPWIDLTRARTCVLLFLILAIPALVGLSLCIGPFQTLDEPSHFYRAVQLSEGRVTPVISPNRNAAGDYLDVNLHKLGGYYLYLSYNQWKSGFGASSQDNAAAWATPLAGREEFVPFSNTVIYFPIAHIVPALAISALKSFHAPPMAWLYGGRMANSALAVVIFSSAIALFSDGRVFVLVFALLPRVLFGTAALSADALLVPFSALFAALVSRLARQNYFSSLHYGLLIFSTFFICLSKIAYLPFVVIPPIVSILAARRLSRDFIVFSISGVLTVAVWLIWMHGISKDVFPIRHNVPIDVYLQLKHVLLMPLHALSVLCNSLLKDGLGYADTLVGGELGSSQTRFPRGLGAIIYVFLIGAAVLASTTKQSNMRELAFVTAISIGVAVAVFLLPYMQYTAVDNSTVDGVQGRYFLPLLPILIAFLPKFRLSPQQVQFASAAIIIWCFFTSAYTFSLMKGRYWTSPQPQAEMRFGDPTKMMAE